MSLLLDALKKAAEQKAEKSKEAQADARPSDETVIDAGAGDVSALDADGGAPAAPRPGRRDETELDHSELDTRLERTRVEREAEDETGLEIADETGTQLPDPSTQMQTGEDETIIFAEEDVSEFMGEQSLLNRESRPPEDETDLSQVASGEDATGHGRPATPAGDDTDLSRLQQDEETDFGQGIFNEDETEFKQRVAEETALEQTPDGEDETDISIPPRLAADVIDAGEAQAALAEDDTDLGRSDEAEDQPVEVITDEDMSLMLQDREDTNLTGGTSVTDPQVPAGQVGALTGDSGDEDLALVDTTRHHAPPAAAPTPPDATSTQATTQSSATTSVATETQTTEGTTRRAETTATRTYAPDNYDRTLMKLPSDDASRLFAGMKSDADVVMTPDYAKKVFQSKSSAQRLQHYKFYAGIAVVILLAIGVYGLFEMQEESNKIDTSLRPLKQDPMPGVIRPEVPSDGVLTLSDVDAQTLKLIQNANDQPDAPVAEQGVISSEPAAAQDSARAPVEPATVPDRSAESSLSGEVGTPSDEPVATASLDASRNSTPAQTAGSDSGLRISSGSRVAEKDVWLREAWEAYQSGNDSLALARYNQVLEIDPANRNALLGRAAINIQNNNSAAAIEDYQTLLLSNPKDTLAMTSLLSVANYSPQMAETQLKLMLRDEPESPYLNFALANAFGAQNRWQEAQRHYFIALENNPGDPNYAYNLAVSLEHIAKPSVAIAYYQRALDNFNNGLATFNREVVDQRLETLRKL